MKVKYIIRLDDACPAMDIGKWDRIEKILDEHAIKPIVAVIPHCEDPDLDKGSRVDDFWGKVKRWEAKDWEIALHGYNHVYTTKNPGLVPINEKSEFAGLSLEEQAEKVKSSYGIFLDNGIKPWIFIAPAHSFDKNTLKALEKETDIRIISDGLAIRPYTFLAFKWIPQQLWKFRTMPFGLWTVCLHPDTMEEKDFQALEKNIAEHGREFIAARDIVYRQGGKDLMDHLFGIFFLARLVLRRLVKS
jgi:predicted deacetylase